MHEQGRRESLNVFMEGKFGFSPKVPPRVHALGYDLEYVMQKDSPIVVDIDEGQGELLLELTESYPPLLEA
jgi:hypothetical protein